jgi:ribosomal protein L37AE/L43A
MTEYATTDAVPRTGEYLCASCGETTEFEASDDFSVCGSCGDENAGWAPVLEEEGDLGSERPEEEPSE